MAKHKHGGGGKHEHRRVPAPNEWREKRIAVESVMQRVASGGTLTTEEFLALPPLKRDLLLAWRVGVVKNGAK